MLRAYASAGMCLRSRCLAMGLYVTILSNDWMMVITELDRIWSWINLRYYPGICLEWLRKSMKNLRIYLVQAQGWTGTSCICQVLPLAQTCSVQCFYRLTLCSRRRWISVGRAIAQASSLRSRTTGVWVRFQVYIYGISGRWSGTGADFLRVLRLFYHFSFHQLSFHPVIDTIYSWYW
jgi:hypothetical protein